jgi:hypothetical protein
MSNLKNIPGMNNLENFMKNMGIPMNKNMKASMAQAQQRMNKVVKQGSQKERMLRKLQERRMAQSQTQSQPQEGMQPREKQHLVFSKEGSKPERSARIKKNYTDSNSNSNTNSNLTITLNDNEDNKNNNNHSQINTQLNSKTKRKNKKRKQNKKKEEVIEN